MRRALVTVVASAVGSLVLVAATGVPAQADDHFQNGNFCAAFGDEGSGWTTVTETLNCDLVQARTYTYIGGGNTTTTYGAQNLSTSTAWKASGGTYSGGAGRLRYNGDWGGWHEL